MKSNRSNLQTVFKSLTFLSIFLFTISQGFSINIIWDFTYDTSNFFASNEKRELLNRVAEAYSDVSFTRDKIEPTGTITHLEDGIRVDGDIVIFGIPHPTTGETLNLDNLVVPKDSVIIYIGADQSMSEGNLGVGGKAGFLGSGSDQWSDLLTGMNTKAWFKPMVGYISVNPNVNWAIDESKVSSNHYLFTTLMHEVLHVLGMGTSERWNVLYDMFDSGLDYDVAYYIGEYGVFAYGGPIRIAPDHSHINKELVSKQDGEGFLGASWIDAGQVRYLSNEEYGILKDLGYTIHRDIVEAPPAPPTPPETEYTDNNGSDDLQNAINKAITDFIKNIDKDRKSAIYNYYTALGSAYSVYYAKEGEENLANFYYYDYLAQAVYWAYDDIPSYYAYKGYAQYCYFENIDTRSAYYYNYVNLAASWYYGYMRYAEMTGNKEYEKAAIDTYNYLMGLAESMKY